MSPNILWFWVFSYTRYQKLSFMDKLYIRDSFTDDHGIFQYRYFILNTNFQLLCFITSSACKHSQFSVNKQYHILIKRKLCLFFKYHCFKFGQFTQQKRCLRPKYMSLNQGSMMHEQGHVLIGAPCLLVQHYGQLWTTGRLLRWNGMINEY